MILSMKNQVKQHIDSLNYQIKELDYKKSQYETFVSWLGLFDEDDDLEKLYNENEKVFNSHYKKELDYFTGIIAEIDLENWSNNYED